jgi:hypothetical protein
VDNRRIDVVSEGDRALELAIELAMGGATASHWKIVRMRRQTTYYAHGVKAGAPVAADVIPHTHGETLVEDLKAGPTLILLWSGSEKGAVELPAEIDKTAAVEFVRNWLKRADYGREPDHDGDNGRGFRVFTEDWGHVYGHHYAIFGVQPAWAMYGK